jgi:hypothetical protein
MQNEQPKKVTGWNICACNQKHFNSFIDNFVTDSKSHQILLYLIPIMKTCHKRFLAHGKLWSTWNSSKNKENMSFRNMS